MQDPFKRDGKWVVRWLDAAGIRRERRTKFTHKAQAEAYLSQLEAEVEFQRAGLKSTLTRGKNATFSQLMDWWIERFGRHLESQTFAGFLEKHLRPAFGTMPIAEMTPAIIEDFLRSKKDALGDESRKKLRMFLGQMFGRAMESADSPWAGPNPVTKVRNIKVEQAPVETLDWHEVAPVLQELEGQARWASAAAIYLALRKGEVFGIWKEDVDLAGRRVLICRSWEKNRTKGRKSRRLVIPEELVPHLEAAMESSTSHLVFPGPDGGLHPREYAIDKKLRRACARAGLVRHYELRCRRKGCGNVEVSKAAVEGKKCPKCGFTFWCKAVPRHVTFHDLRHTSATRMLDGGADLRLVQDVLGHKDPNTTARYTHLLMRGVERAQATLQFGAVDAKAPRPGMEAAVDPEGAPEVRPSGSAKGEGRVPSDSSSEDAAFELSGRLDLNQRPLAPQRRIRAAQGLPLAAPARKGLKIRSPRRDAAAHQAHWAHRVSQGMGRIWGAETCR